MTLKRLTLCIAPLGLTLLVAVAFSIESLSAQTSDSTSSDARQSTDAKMKSAAKKKKKTLSSDELEGVIQELAKKLKETKAREAEEHEQKRKEVQERISKNSERIRSGETGTLH